ncbi:MAG TPA: hypothetical protein VJ832_12810 [Variovorax sp.]|jgi:hypothetical protein|nr:hypothetical protein [Variovorax sp.]
MTVELHHSLDQYLASVEQAPACIVADGSLVFEAGEQLRAYAALVPDGRLELFAGMGYVRAELLQAIEEADEDDAFDEDVPRHVADVMVRWAGEGAQWAVDVHRRTGLLTLCMFVKAIPGDPTEWAATVDAFRHASASWVARLQRDPPDPLPHPGPGLADISSGAFLRC